MSHALKEMGRRGPQRFRSQPVSAAGVSQLSARAIMCRARQSGRRSRGRRPSTRRQLQTQNEPAQVIRLQLPHFLDARFRIAQLLVNQLYHRKKCPAAKTSAARANATITISSVSCRDHHRSASKSINVQPTARCERPVCRSARATCRSCSGARARRSEEPA